MKNGVELITEERKRQINKEGWSAGYDDYHENEELSEAAKCYVTSAQACNYGDNCVTYDKGYRPNEGMPPDWPFDKGWKPTGNSIRDLVKAGALIAAEIDRIQRL